MRHPFLLPGVVGSVLLVLLPGAPLAQGRGGGRGPSEAIRSRSGAYFAEASLPSPAAGKADVNLAETAFVKKAVEKKQLSLLYLYDPRANEMKHKNLELVVFGNQAVGIALRFFKCARIDLTKDPGAKSFDPRKAPIFVAFDEAGKQVGELSMAGYHSSPRKLIGLLSKAANGYSKESVSKFVKDYRRFLNDLQRIEGKQRTLDQKRQRLTKKRGNDKKVDKDVAALEKEQQKLFESEKKLLELAKIPKRDENTTRLGERPRGGRR